VTTSLRLRGIQRNTFRPTTITGLFGWFDFSDATTLYTDLGTTLVTADADIIEQINDKSGIGNHATQTTLANRPLYKTNIQNAKSVGRFAATDFIGTGSPVGGDKTQPLTYFVVGKITSSGGATANTFVDGTTNGKRNVVYRKASTGEWTIYSGTTQVTGTASDTSFHIFAATFNGASSSMYVGGGAANVSGSPGTHTCGGVRMGSDSGSSGNLLGDICEVLTYTGALSLANINSVGSYLSTKWNVTWTTAT
jgi:hypothetical protein